MCSVLLTLQLACEPRIHSTSACSVALLKRFAEEHTVKVYVSQGHNS